MAETPSEAGSPTPLRLRVLGAPRHECHGCSACCSSYRIGPLLPDDLERLERAIPLVRATFPQQLDGPVTMTSTYRGQDATFLRKRGGFCVFHSQATGCTLHAAAGGDQKPLVCQLFPLQLVNTDDGLRLGMRPTCLSDWQVWEDGPMLPGEFLERVAGNPHSATLREEPPGEDVTLRLLRLPDLDTGTLLSFLAELPDRGTPPEVDEWLQARLVDLFAAADAVTGGEFGDDELGPLHPRTTTAAEFGAFRTWAEQRNEPLWPEVPEDGLPHLRDALGRLVFLRQTSLYPTLPWALLGYIAAARWAGAYAGSGDGGFELRRFGRCLSTLLVILESPRMQRSLLEAGPPFA
jgi:Fe-S-cluster containining protein